MKQNSNLEITKMQKEHIAEIARLEKECFSAPWSEKMIEEELLNPLSHYYVAQSEDGVCGYVGLHTVLDEGYITNIAVDKRFRRMGIASKLLESLISENEDLSFITLEVRVSNAPAIALYEQFGFESVGERRNYYTNPCENALLMTKFREK